MRESLPLVIKTFPVRTCIALLAIPLVMRAIQNVHGESDKECNDTKDKSTNIGPLIRTIATFCVKE